MNQHTLDVLEYDKIRELLVSYATSGLGKNLAQRIHPLTDVRRIERLNAETTELKRLLSPERSLPLGGLHDLFPLLEKLEKGEDILPPEEILLINDTLRAARIVKGYLEGLDNSYPHLRQFARSISIYPEIEAKIEMTFGPSGEMKSSASSELKSIRKKIQVLRGRIRDKLQAVLRAQNVSPHLQDTVIRERKGRPVIAVKEREASRVPGAVRDKSDSGTTLFIEPDAIRGMGDELQTAMDAEKAEMVRILREITAIIAEKIAPLRETLNILAHTDLTYAKVRFSRDFEMNPPLLNTDGIIDLKGARHPLLLALQRTSSGSGDSAATPPHPSPSPWTGRVVPIDFRLGDDFNTLIITGPNTGGKTLTLKTVGLLTLMAQSGLHVPAGENSTLAVFDEVSVDIGDEQSIKQSLSTFSSHLRNIAGILSHANEKSLVLLDELGGGTDPAEGAALGTSILEYLHARHARTVVTTHISPLKNLGYTVPGVENASVEFDIATLRPTYKLLIGTPGSSNALAIAKRLGLPHEVIANAEKSSTQQDNGEAELINQLQAARKIAVENKRLTAQAKAEALRLEGEYRQKLDELAMQEMEMRDQLSKDAFTTLRAVKGQMDGLRSSEASRTSLLNALDEISMYIAERLNESPEGSQRLKLIRQLKPGDEVRVRSLDRAGILNTVDSRTQKAVVQFGVMQMTVPLEDVEFCISQ